MKEEKPVCLNCGNDSFYEEQQIYGVQNIIWSDTEQKYKYGERTISSNEIEAIAIYCDKCEAEVKFEHIEMWIS